MLAWRSGICAFDINCLNSSSNTVVEASWKWQILCNSQVQGIGLRTVLLLIRLSRNRLILEFKEKKKLQKKSSPLHILAVSLKHERATWGQLLTLNSGKQYLSIIAQGLFACYFSNITKVSSHSLIIGTFTQEGMQLEVDNICTKF